MEPDSSLLIRASVCCFVDILGQKAELAKFSDTPLDAALANDPEFQEYVDKTYRRVRFFHDGLCDFISNIQKVAGTTIPGERGEYIRKLMANNIDVKPFSDGIFLSLPLTLDKEISPIHGVSCMIGACASSMLQNLATETAIRGGVEVGTIADIGRNAVCGPGVAEAHRLEESIAQYPRIVIGQKLAEYIIATCHMDAEIAAQLNHVTDPETFAKVASSSAKVCRDMMLRDFDGNYIVHYLSPRALKGLGEDITGTLVKHAKQFVIAQANHWQEKRDTKHSMRYSHLVNYFETFAAES